MQKWGYKETLALMIETAKGLYYSAGLNEKDERLKKLEEVTKQYYKTPPLQTQPGK